MDNAGAGFQRDIVGEMDRRIALVKWVMKSDVLQRITLAGGNYLAFQLITRHTGRLQMGRKQQTAALGLNQGVVEIRMHIQRLIGGNSPWRGGPDQRKHIAIRQLAQAKRLGKLCPLTVDKRKAHIDGDGLLVLVLNFSFGQRRAAVEAPIDGLEAAIKIAALHDLAERADFVRLGLKIHGGVGMIPVAQYAQANKIRFLQFDLLARVSARELLDFLRRDVLAVLLFDLDFDGHAMAIPAGHIDRVVARHLLGLDDDVFKNFIDGVANMNCRVGVGRAIVQDKNVPPA